MSKARKKLSPIFSWNCFPSSGSTNFCTSFLQCLADSFSVGVGGSWDFVYPTVIDLCDGDGLSLFLASCVESSSVLVIQFLSGFE